MEFKLNNKQLIGLFVILTIAAIYLFVHFLRGEDVFKKSADYYAVFEEVEGLTATSPVYIRGLKVGSVEKIKFNNAKWNFVVKITVKDYYKVPKNSIVEIYSTDILGGKAIRIDLGNGGIMAKKGDTLSSATVPDMLTVLQSELGPVKEQVEQMLISLNGVLYKINNILDDRTQNDVRIILDNLKTTLENTNAISENLKIASPEIKTIVTNLDILSKNLKNGSEDLNSTLTNAKQITYNLKEADLKGTIENLKIALEKIQDPNGTLGKLMISDSLHNSLNEAINNANNLIKKISDNPKKYIKITVF